MIFWLDAHLSPRIARWVTAEFQVPARPLRDLGLRHADDDQIWDVARKPGYVIITKDSDFEERVRRIGPPPQVIWLTCGNTSEERLQEIFTKSLPDAMELLKSGTPIVEIG